MSAASPLVRPWEATAVLFPELTEAERTVLGRISNRVHPSARAALDRLVGPIDEVTVTWNPKLATNARNFVLAEVHRREVAYWAWDQDVWLDLLNRPEPVATNAKFHIVGLGYLLGGHHRLHHPAGIWNLGKFAALVFGPGAVDPAVQDVLETLRTWHAGEHNLFEKTRAATTDALLSSGSPRLEDITEDALLAVLNDHRGGRVSNRRGGITKLSRVLAHRGIIAEPLSPNRVLRGPRPATLADVPAEWVEWAERWRKLAPQEPRTVRVMFTVLLIAGRWAAEKHPDAITPDLWTRDMAAEYVADTMTATVGQWAGHNTNRVRYGQPLSVSGQANRIDALRGFFCNLIDWEWLKPRFDPRRVLSLPLSKRAMIGPNPRIIDDAAWAKLMAAGLTLEAEDLTVHGTPSARAVGRADSYYPIEMMRALVGVWLFAGCRIDEIRRLEVDRITWDKATDEHTGETYRICLLRVPANKTSREFTKPVDPLVGELVEAWQAVRPPQPDIEDRKTRQRRQHLFCHRGQLIGLTYLNTKVIPVLCAKAGIPEADSRGALTSHRARATIATQLLNAREPLSLADLQQWLGHKHASSTRHYAAILQRTLAGAYKRADYFARNVRTIQVLIDRETILTGAAAGGEPWKYYDLGDGYCSYDFFAKCPHRLACARCPFYLPKNTTKGQLLEVKAGIERMLEQLDLTDDERAALEGDHEAVTALADRLAEVPTPGGPTPKELGTAAAFIPLTTVLESLPSANQGGAK